MPVISRRKVTKVLWFSLPMQLPIQGQWWSNTWTQRSQTWTLDTDTAITHSSLTEQCFDLATFLATQLQQ